ncbi:hypothetical protein COW94_01115 [Candidatus Peregrinibacteria bacterium CG22_combo_CG10-13_8_21_14_all_44_10]|nr:MAG: hypothetical protein AUK45_04820 [Candidatus Peregrinibacteria bacterium CG2_30_44_17]PIP66558.1 MAG: hypothetical protein COW94_01115 [Candidatus Peregrinibacteria bacterium CG22_combo_CG10-13_8_21_14_all_44_10]PIS04290.1 MAG: hypothetical protein COT83_01415 [Candidatus Peregrinibacteria bacterium CG10_big_fil_rev_8_21_14_0_10_44_7]PIX80467.1 MAG: hypothetical protein COZ35_00665 [Candidatus Peregrinibacteria bacterium CG_4_10_14_3_um_filter_44_21]PJB89021.1 MAG: hypothetical protein 
MYKIKDNRASALLVAILIMSVLMVMGLGINRLIIAELRIERTLVGGGQAYYSAEAGTELALYDIVSNVDGYEVTDETGELPNSVLYSYSIDARSDIWPCDVYGDKVYEDDSGVLWRALEPEESVMTPLFYDDGSSILNMGDFQVYYMVTTETGIYPTDEVVRWKILGIDQSGFTEAISSYDEVSGGTSSWTALTKESGSYQSVGASWGGREYEWADQNVSNFLNSHYYNYLIITNVIQDPSLADRLYVRLDSSNTEFVCEYVKAEADGINGEYVQQIDVYMKEGEPLPVFDFVLFEKDI